MKKLSQVTLAKKNGPKKGALAHTIDSVLCSEAVVPAAAEAVVAALASAVVAEAVAV